MPLFLGTLRTKGQGRCIPMLQYLHSSKLVLKSPHTILNIDFTLTASILFRQKRVVIFPKTNIDVMTNVENKQPKLYGKNYRWTIKSNLHCLNFWFNLKFYPVIFDILSKYVWNCPPENNCQETESIYILDTDVCHIVYLRGHFCTKVTYKNAPSLLILTNIF